MTARPDPQPNITACPLDDELVLYELTRGQAYVLNATAAQIWRWCDGRRSVTAIAHALAAAHGLPNRQALADVRACLAALQEAGLLRP